MESTNNNPKFIYESTMPIVNREQRRKAAKEIKKHHHLIEKVEEEYMELLFDCHYSFDVLNRWIQIIQKYWKQKIRQDAEIIFIQPTDEDIFSHLKPEETFSQTEFDKLLNSVTTKLREIAK